jgi:hypothetical protein
VQVDAVVEVRGVGEDLAEGEVVEVGVNSGSVCASVETRSPNSWS